MMEKVPKISIVTPNFNQGNYIEKTILSVINQGYPNLEYIIIDGCSTDNSVDIVKKYEDKLHFWSSEKDSGLYDALNKGFKIATGDIMMYINSDDILHPKSLSSIARTFLEHKGLQWISGYYTWINEQGKIIGREKNINWTILDYLAKNYQWIQQESTVWSRSLWLETGGHFNADFRFAGDLELWSRFFLQSNPVIVDFPIGAFRIRNNQMSKSNANEYNKEAEEAISNLQAKVSRSIILRSFLHKLLMLCKKMVKRTSIFGSSLIIILLDKCMIYIKGNQWRISYYNDKKQWIKYKESRRQYYKL